MANGVSAKGRNYVFWLGIALCTLYYSYRYPLQINSSGTSETYSDTPAVLQAGKFALAFPLLVISIVLAFTHSSRLSRWLIAIAALFVSGFAVLKFLQDTDFQLIDFSFWFIFSLFLSLAVQEVSVLAVDKYFYLMLAYAFGTTFIQLFLFIAFGRLPALAWAGGYSVRFGGFLDDPNGFAAILFLLLGWSWLRFLGWVRVVVVTGIVICLGLTQSWTALAFFLATALAYFLYRAFRRPLGAILAVCVLPFLAFFVLNLIPLLQQGFLLEMLQQKQGSIEGHLFPWADWLSRWPHWAFLGNQQYSFYESWWASSLINFGVMWLAVYSMLIIVLLMCVWSAFNKAQGKSRSVYGGLLLFGLYFSLGSLNLPLPTVFPINVLFFVFFFLVSFGKITSNADEPVAALPSRVRMVCHAAQTSQK